LPEMPSETKLKPDRLALTAFSRLKHAAVLIGRTFAAFVHLAGETVFDADGEAADILPGEAMPQTDETIAPCC